MPITRTVDWRLIVPADEADRILRDAFQKVGLGAEGAPGTIVGKSKANLLKNRWAATVQATVRGHGQGSLVELRIEMPGGTKHYAVADDIAKEVGEKIFDDRGLDAALARLGKFSRAISWLSVGAVRNVLTGTETILEIGQGNWNGHTELVLLSDERLFFFGKDPFVSGLTEFPLAGITSLSSAKAPTGETLTFTVAGNAYSVANMGHGQGDAILRAYRQLSATPAAPAAPVVVQQAPSDADELSKLADLRDRGILTDEEFAAKKAQILGL